LHHGANDDIEDGREDFFRPGVEVEKLGSAHEFDRLAYIGDRLVLDCDFENTRAIRSGLRESQSAYALGSEESGPGW
jgi:hypothetical protein